MKAGEIVYVQAVVIESNEGTLLVRLKSGFGDPEIRIAPELAVEPVTV